MVVITEPISTTNITGLRIWMRGSSFLKLSISARVTISRWNSETAWRSFLMGPPTPVDIRGSFRESFGTNISPPCP